jgi:transcriptional regulator with GAF, ATPase, and Fis domain
MTMDASQFLGASEGAHNIRTTVDFIAKTDTTVMLLGETGTGKEVLARAIHAQSRRAMRAFIPVDCPAITETLAESELFGHVKGAFTSSTERVPGLIEEADKGTLFLDEIGDMHPAVQLKLLRFLGDGTGTVRPYKKVGSSKPACADIRIIVATNQNLSELVSKGKFRKDLYFRLAVFTMRIPALRERKEDVAILAQSFLRERQISREALSVLERHTWEGNVRELQNVLTTACHYSAMRGESTILPDHLRFEECPVETDLLQVLVGDGPIPDNLDRSEVFYQVDAELVRKALRQTGGHKRRAAELLEMSYRNLLLICRQHGLGAVRRNKSYRAKAAAQS